MANKENCDPNLWNESEENVGSLRTDVEKDLMLEQLLDLEEELIANRIEKHLGNTPTQTPYKCNQESGEKTYKCGFCIQYNATSHHLSQRKKHKGFLQFYDNGGHEESLNFTCEQCRHRYKICNSVGTHIAREHAENRQCHVCCMIFEIISTLE